MLGAGNDNRTVCNFNWDRDQALSCAGTAGAQPIVEIEQCAVGCAEDLILVAGQKPVGEGFEGREGVGTGVHICHAARLGSHNKQFETLAPVAKGEALRTGHINVIQRTEVRASGWYFGEPFFAALFVAKALGGAGHASDYFSPWGLF